MSKLLDYSLDYELLHIKEAEKQALETQGGSKFVFENFITSLATAKYPQGMKGLNLRIFGRILEKLDKSTDTIEFETAEFDLLKEFVLSDEISVLPQQARLYNYYRRKFEQINN